MENNYGGYIKQIVFNSGLVLELEKNDIVLFVGPNNSGKSQSLKDIYYCAESSTYNGIVVQNVDVEIDNRDIDELIKRVCVRKESNLYYFLNKAICGVGHNPIPRNSKSFGDAKPIFVANLTTEQRLSFSKPVENADIDGSKFHPLHYLVDNTKYSSFIADEFEKAFGYRLIPNFMHRSISLHIGNKIVLDNPSNDESIRRAQYQSVLDKYPQIQHQGDGMRSFASVLLELCLDFRRVYLIDEPESFLHQPQARMMGRLLGENLKDNQQAFISTHSEEIIKGLLDTAKERVKIVRITRKEDVNFFSVLNHQDIEMITNDSMLKHTELLSGMFYNNVVLCESDSDCLFYSSIDSYLKEKEGKYSNTLFVRCGGKSGFSKAATALLGLGVKTKCVLDIDALNSEAYIKDLIRVFGYDYSLIKSDYKIFNSWVLSQPNSPKTKQEIIKMVDELAKQSNDDHFNSNEANKIKKFVKTNKTVWDDLKSSGSSLIDEERVLSAFENLLNKLAEINIYILNVGEIERFVPLENNAHSYEWVESVFNTYPDFSNPVYNDAIEFVKKINI